MPKLPECHHCQLSAHSYYLVCAIHPDGPSTNSCPDFWPAPKAEPDSWASTGYAWYGGSLIASTERLTQCDRLDLLETYPLFTGRCPNCDGRRPTVGHHEYEETHPVHWDCPECGWKGDGV